MWFTELHSPGAGITIRIKGTLFADESAFQRVAVLETEDFGRMLTLDGAVQTTEQDEFIYHEMLVHVPLCVHPRPRRVLVVGGGDGGCLREVLRHPGVEEATLCEIDGMVVDCCRSFMPGVSAGAFDDPRARVLIEDGVKLIRRSRGAFDVIIVDSTDPIAMASPLTRLSFFRAARAALAPGGLYAAQSQGPLFEARGMRRISRTIRKAFPRVDFYLAGVPTYPGGVWSFTIAAAGGKTPAARPPRALPPGVETRYYSPEVHRAAFALPPYVREILR